MSNIQINIVSKDGRFSIDDKCIASFFSQHPDCYSSVEVYKHAENKTALPILYNSLLDKLDSKFQFIAFMHADVYVSLESLLSHISQCKDKYDVMGLCGCSKISVSQSPLNWFTGSRPFPNERWGCVTHGELGNKMSFFNKHSPNEMDHSAACIDGLCIVFGPKAIAANLRFDERLHFNCYDTQISFEAVMKKGLKLGVLVEKSLQHYSVGKSILTDEFLKDEIVLRERYGLGFPAGSKIEKMHITSANLQ